MDRQSNQTDFNRRRPLSYLWWMGGLLVIVLATLYATGTKEQEHTAEAVNDADSLAFMTANGVSTLISDSGVIRYKLVAEEWQIHNSLDGRPATWKFFHGFFMERFDEKMHADLFVQADTAFLHEQKTWEMRGRVIIKNLEGTLFLTQELFWDMSEHKMWNHVPMDIYMPERELHGTEFRSNEQMTDYFVMNSAGAFPAEDTENAPEEEQDGEDKEENTESESVKDNPRPAPKPHVQPKM